MSNIKKTNDEIFNWIIEYEDELLNEIREKVISTAKFNYGDRGRDIAVKYYKQLDGEEEYDITEIDEDCNDCKERAKKLIETAEFSKTTIDILTDDKITQLIKNIDINCIDNLEDTIQKIVCNSLFEIDEETRNRIKVRILLEFCKKILNKNDNSPG